MHFYRGRLYRVHVLFWTYYVYIHSALYLADFCRTKVVKLDFSIFRIYSGDLMYSGYLNSGNIWMVNSTCSFFRWLAIQMPCMVAIQMSCTAKKFEKVEQLIGHLSINSAKMQCQYPCFLRKKTKNVYT